jgi:hypothetical protein
MKNAPIVVGLSVAVAACGFWSYRMNAKIAAAEDEIAALNKKLLTAQREVSLVQAQGRSVQMANTGPVAASTGVAPMGPNQAAANPRAAYLAAQNMPPGPERAGALMDALVAFAKLDPEGAWDEAMTLPEDAGKGRLQLQKDILKAWAAKNPAQAAAKYDALATKETSANASNVVGTIESNWLKQDPEAASKWVETLPVGSTRDSAIRALVPIATETDPPTAFKWADTLSDPSYRGTLINGVTEAWAKTDPDAAITAVLSRPNKNNGRMEALAALVIKNAPAGWVPPPAAAALAARAR